MTRTLADLEAQRAQVLSCLNGIEDPCSVASGFATGITDLGLIEHVTVSPEGDVALRLRLTSPFCEMIAFFKREAALRLTALQWVRSVHVETDSGLDWTVDNMSGAALEKRARRLQSIGIRARRVDPGEQVSLTVVSATERNADVRPEHRQGASS